MVDRSFETKTHSQAKQVTLLKNHVTLEVLSIDESDTFTVENLTNIDYVRAVNISTGADVAVSAVGNVVTVDEVAASGIHIIALVVGT